MQTYLKAQIAQVRDMYILAHKSAPALYAMLEIYPELDTPESKKLTIDIEDMAHRHATNRYYLKTLLVQLCVLRDSHEAGSCAYYVRNCKIKEVA